MNMCLRILGFALLLILLGNMALADGAPATGCATTAPATQGYERNLPCCTHPDYNPATDGTRCLGPISSFILQLRQFGFLREDGHIFYFGSPQSFDLASADAGAAFGNFVASADLPAGNYIGIVPVVGKYVAASINIRIPNGRRCTLSSAFDMMDSSLPQCTESMPNLGTMECIESNGTYGRFINDEMFNIAYDPARGMTVQFGFWLDNGAVCDFTGSGDVTADFFDMPVVARVTAN